MTLARRGPSRPCDCVRRLVFEICYERFRDCVTKEKFLTKAALYRVAGREAHFNWGRLDEEYIADFQLIARRTLEEVEYRVFKYHYLLGAGPRLCRRKLGMDKTDFFHLTNRIQQKLGWQFMDLKPYGLYPLDEYFQCVSRLREPIAPFPGPEPGRPRRGALEFPMPPGKTA